MSNERVDVLAVMDTAIEASLTRAASIGGAAWIHQQQFDELVEARAAVAELIEAVKAIKVNPHVHLGDLVYEVREREGQGWNGQWCKQWSDAVDKFDSALARIGGAR